MCVKPLSFLDLNSYLKCSNHRLGLVDADIGIFTDADKADSLAALKK